MVEDAAAEREQRRNVAGAEAQRQAEQAAASAEERRATTEAARLEAEAARAERAADAVDPESP